MIFVKTQAQQDAPIQDQVLFLVRSLTLYAVKSPLVV
jgi:hypothetical protein